MEVVHSIDLNHIVEQNFMIFENILKKFLQDILRFPLLRKSKSLKKQNGFTATTNTSVELIVQGLKKDM